MSEGQEKPSQSAVSTADQEDSEKDDDSLDTPIGCLRCRKEACRQCCCTLNNYWKSVIWCSIIIVYLLLGGIFFTLAERPAELDRIAEVDTANATLQAARGELIASVANNSNLTVVQIAEMLQNFTAASQRLNDALEATDVVQVWDFASAVFFCVTVITTIGYGNIAPLTGSGQTLFIFYALLGIPLALTFLSTIGQILTDYLDAALKPLLSHKRGKKNPVLFKGIGILVFLSLALVFMIFIPSGIFYATEDWTYGQSIYYCFVTLTTVGFGDFVPAIAGSSRETSNAAPTGLYKIIVAVWLWIGLAFVAAIITELTNFIDAVSKRLRRSRCCSRGAGSVDTEKQELNVVSSPSPTPTDGAAAESAQKASKEQTAESANTTTSD